MAAIMYVAVVNLFRGRVSHTDYFNVKVQSFASHRVIAIYSDFVAVDGSYNNMLLPLRSLSRKTHAYFYVVHTTEHVS
jgi:hypothetical protein